jgi:N6-adenosine-specific RNA methylase IME4
MNLEIKKQFKDIIPPLTDAEFQQLESNILAEGIREAICTWNNVIIDGHNRYAIAQQHGLEFRVKEYEFTSEFDAIDWIVDNQLGRRNLTELQKAYLRGVRHENEKQKHKTNQHTKVAGCQNGTQQKTREKLADEYNVSPETIARDAQFAKGIDHLSDDLKQEVLQGKEKINKGDIQQLAKAEPLFIANTKEEILQKAKELKSEKEAERKQKRAAIQAELQKMELAPSDKKYRIIYADPPWSYGNAMPEYVTEPQDYYLLMSTEDICNMPVKEITQKDAVLFLWSTSPHLPEALQVAKAWGFEYKTSFVWDKIKHNMGHYNSVRHEFLLVCVKGSCTPDNRKLYDSVVSIERGAHSEKPEFFRQIIEDIYLYGNKIELFAREAADGWDVFGNQINI